MSAGKQAKIEIMNKVWLLQLSDEIHIINNLHAVSARLEGTLINLPFIQSAFFCFFNNQYNLLPSFSDYCQDCKNKFDIGFQCFHDICKFKNKDGYIILPLRSQFHHSGNLILKIINLSAFTEFRPYIQNLVNLFTWKIEFQIREWEYQKLAIEKKLQGERYQSIFNSAASLIMSVNRDCIIADCNLRITRLLGYSQEDIVGIPIQEIIHPDYLDRVKLCLSETFRSGYSDIMEYKMVKKNGATIDVRVHSSGLKDDQGEFAWVINIIEDITTQNRLYAKLELSQNIVDNIPIGLYIYHLEDLDDDFSLRMVYANPASENLTGVAPSNIVGKTLDENFPGLRAKGIPQKYAEVIRTQQAVVIEDLSFQYNRTIPGDFFVKAFPLPENHAGVTFDNITERIRMEGEIQATNRQLQQQKTELSLLLKAARTILEYRDFSREAVIIFNDCRDLIGAKAGYVALLSEDGQENEVLYLNPGEYQCRVDPDLPMPIRGLRARAYTERKAVYENSFKQTDYTQFIPAGHVVLENVLFAPLLDKDRAVGLIGLANKPGGFTDDDVRIIGAFSELASVALLNSHSLELLKQKEDQFNKLMESNVVGILYMNNQGDIYNANAAFLKIIGYPGEDLQTGRLNWFKITPEDFLEQDKRLLKQLLDRDTVAPYEKECIHKNGTRIPILTGGFTLDDGRKNCCCIVIDLSMRKKIENDIRKSLKEKEILLQEVHHRVKNNLQVVSSLVGLQMLRIKDPAYLSAFEDIKNRIFTMALLHQLLYQSRDFSNIDMVYFIQEISQYLGKSLKTDMSNIRFDIKLSEVVLSLEKAIPCGLIINEVISNSIKYAFPENRKGIIFIRLYRSDKVTLEIGDNGIGLPGDIDIKTTASLGLTLLQAFTQQLDGELKLSREKGTKYIISFQDQVQEENGEE